jgi:LysM repeat protein
MKIRRPTFAVGCAALTAVLLFAPAPAAAVNLDAPLQACTRFYTVRRGDTLSRVARRFGTTPSKLMSLNSMPAVTAVTLGRTLCVRASTATVGAVTMLVTVQKGETIARIAKRYGTSVATLRKLNRVRTVKVGQTIVVPVKRVKARGV